MNWLAVSLIALGYLFVANKSEWGFIIQLVGCVLNCWFYFKKDWAVFSINALFALINMWGFYQWQ